VADELYIRCGQMPPQEGFEGMTSGFSHMPQSTVLNDTDVGISPHAVGQHSDWPTAEAVKSHIKLRPHHCFWIVFYVSFSALTFMSDRKFLSGNKLWKKTEGLL